MNNTGAALLRAALTSIAVAGVVAALMFAGAPHFRISSAPFVEVAGCLPNTLLLIAASIVIALVLAVPCGLIESRRGASWIGRAILLAVFPVSRIPVFWLALALQLILAVRGGLPTAGMLGADKFSAPDLIRHLALPAAALGLFQAGAYMLWLQKGASRSALFAGFSDFLPSILSASVLIEAIYAWPGEGRLFYQATVSDPKGSFFFAFFVINGVLVVGVRALADAIRKSKDSEFTAVEGL
jgi:peptide/nickel transport system permease protein